METKRKAKGSWGVRFFIVVLGITLAFLFYWLLSFIEGDIGKIERPDKHVVRRQYISEELDDQKEALQKDIQRLSRKIKTLDEQLHNLKKSTSNYQNTINQLLPIQKQSIEQGIEFPLESRQALSSAQAAFLENQKRDQDLNKQISELTLARQEKQADMNDLNETIEPFEEEFREEWDRQQTAHNWKVAAIKLAVLIPIFIAASIIFMKYRTSAYWPLVWAVFAASFFKVAFVAHKYFPKPYFKYIAVLVIIVIVLRFLIYLIKMIVAPQKDLLIKQYQQFYDKHRCPICTKPIKAGPLRYAGWKKKTTVVAPQGTQIDEQQAYTCPSCGTNLYDKCGSCGKIRHTLLPYCEHCGVEKTE
ncbi:MAG: hypothetical protein ABFR90_06715 [Planctomycetota bacterium]